MARNKVQFQKGLSEAEFERLFGTEEQCLAQVIAWRWPKGIECPQCEDTRYCVIKPSPSYPRGLYAMAANARPRPLRGPFLPRQNCR